MKYPTTFNPPLYMRVVSLLPSATEVLALVCGSRDVLKKMLVGVSHECDYPTWIHKSGIPVLTAAKTNHRVSSAKEIDRQVREALQDDGDLYFLNSKLLEELQPDVILTQDLCNVCSIDLKTVQAVCKVFPTPAKIVSLNPHTIQEILESILVVGKAVGMEKEAQDAHQLYSNRIAKIMESENASKRNKNPRTITFIEWTDPIFVGGHW